MPEEPTAVTAAPAPASKKKRLSSRWSANDKKENVWDKEMAPPNAASNKQQEAGACENDNDVGPDADSERQ